ncbi:MAG: NfeD family protein [Gammaproteobacteria bacterium]|nr:NfeD family protein [Gammaproteobacteria bacterium]
MDPLTHWHWWIAALVLLVLEIFVSGTFFMWMGISAVLVGLLAYLFSDMGWTYQMMVFSIVSVASIVIWRQYQEKHPQQSDQPTLNRRGSQYIGRTFTLQEPIVNGNGKIKVDDTTWKVLGPDCDSGQSVRVTGVDGTMLVVESAD